MRSASTARAGPSPPAMRSFPPRRWMRSRRSARCALRAGPVEDRDPGRARHRVPRRPYRRGGGRGRLERPRLRALPERERSAFPIDRAGAPTQYGRTRARSGASGVRGGGADGGGFRRPGGAHRRPPGPSQIQRGAPPSRRRAGEGGRHGSRLPARPRLSRRTGRARGARRARFSPRRSQRAVRGQRPAGRCAGGARRRGQDTVRTR